MSRPSGYQPTFPRQARKLCLLGATNADLAEFFGIAHGTLDNWRNRHKAFREAIEDGKEVADSKVAASLYRRALGFQHKAVKIFYDAKNESVVQAPYIERYPPDTVACIFWLKNRRPGTWRDRPPEVSNEDVDTQAQRLRDAVREMDEADGE